MARSDGRILSMPCEVHFAGFRTTTLALQRAGWQLSMEQEIHTGRLRLAMRFEPARIYMMSEAIDFDYFRHVDEQSFRPTFVVRHVASNITVQLMESSFDFKPVDATPQYVEAQRKSIEDFAIFAPAQTRTEEILIEPRSVAECLELIRKMQAPELAAIRERNKRRHEPGYIAEPMPKTTFHAQVLSIAA